MGKTLLDDKSEMGVKLASDDFREYNEKIIENDLLKKECNLLKNLIEIFSLHDNKFSKFKDLNNKQFILFTKNHQIFKPSCQIIESFRILNQTLKCYEDIPVIFNYTTPGGQSTREINGFLSLNGVIKNYGNEMICSQEAIYMKLENSNVSIRKLNNTYKIFNNLSYPQRNVHIKNYVESVIILEMKYIDVTIQVS